MSEKMKDILFYIGIVAMILIGVTLTLLFHQWTSSKGHSYTICRLCGQQTLCTNKGHPDLWLCSQCDYAHYVATLRTNSKNETSNNREASP